LRKNNIASLEELKYLQRMPSLRYKSIASKLTLARVLWLSDNPCADLPHYRLHVIKMVPQLAKLDNQGKLMVASMILIDYTDIGDDERAKAAALPTMVPPLQ
jgi:hypothetical protein